MKKKAPDYKEFIEEFPEIKMGIPKCWKKDPKKWTEKDRKEHLKHMEIQV